jgi:hypothetical protein
LTAHFPTLPAGYELASLELDPLYRVIVAHLEGRPTLVLLGSQWRVITDELLYGVGNVGQ